MQLEVDADPIALYMALPAAHIRPSPLSFSFIPVAVYIQRAVEFPRQAIDIAFDYVGKVNVVVTRDNDINALLIIKVGTKRGTERKWGARIRSRIKRNAWHCL